MGTEGERNRESLRRNEELDRFLLRIPRRPGHISISLPARHCLAHYVGEVQATAATALSNVKNDLLPLRFFPLKRGLQETPRSKKLASGGEMC